METVYVKGSDLNLPQQNKLYQINIKSDKNTIIDIFIDIFIDGEILDARCGQSNNEVYILYKQYEKFYTTKFNLDSNPPNKLKSINHGNNKLISITYQKNDDILYGYTEDNKIIKVILSQDGPNIEDTEEYDFVTPNKEIKTIDLIDRNGNQDLSCIVKDILDNSYSLSSIDFINLDGNNKQAQLRDNAQKIQTDSHIENLDDCSFRGLYAWTNDSKKLYKLNLNDPDSLTLREVEIHFSPAKINPQSQTNQNLQGVRNMVNIQAKPNKGEEIELTFAEVVKIYSKVRKDFLDNIDIKTQAKKEKNIDEANEVKIKIITNEGAIYKTENLEKINLESAIFDDKYQLNNINLQSAILKGVSLKQARLTDVNLTKANLEGADLSEAVLIGVCLEGANLENINLKDAVLRYVNLKNTNIPQNQLSNVKEMFSTLT